MSNQFMKPQTYYGDWYVITGDAGSLFLPVQAHGELPIDPDNPEYVHEESLWELDDYYHGSKVTKARAIKGWGARLRARSYLHCTDWIGPFGTKVEALDELEKLHGDD